MRRYGFVMALIVGLSGLTLVGCDRGYRDNGNEETSRLERDRATTEDTGRSAYLAPKDTTSSVQEPAAGGAPATGMTGSGTALKPESNQPGSDAWMTFKVATSLYANDQVEGDYDVDTRAGVVTLRGTVNSEAARQQATDVARRIEGVIRVDNQLTVMTEKRSEMAEERSEVLKDRIDNMVDLGRYKDADVKVEVFPGGKVTLKGEVTNATMAYEIMNAVQKTQGVRSVDSQLTLER